MMRPLIALALVFLTGQAEASSKRRPVQPEPTPTVTATAVPSPSPTVTVVPTASPQVFVTFGPGAHSSLKPGGVDYAYGQRTLALLNEAVSSGCVLEQALSWDFQSLHGVVNPALKRFQATEAMQRYFAGAPYALDAGWYTSSWFYRDVVGYTFNCLGGECNEWNTETETRIWTNLRINLSEAGYASHLAHELSHQKWAGGFVHWSFHQGSFPYEIGDIVASCIARIRSRSMMLMAMPEPEQGRPSAKGKPVTPREKLKAHSTEGCFQ